MKRPRLLHFFALDTTKHLCIRGVIYFVYSPFLGIKKKSPSLRPWASLNLFARKNFHITVEGYDQHHQLCLQEKVRSDSFGLIEARFEKEVSQGPQIEYLKIYEESSLGGLRLFLGEYQVINFQESPKVIISDLDKTLIETSFSGMKDLYLSLSKPLEYFETISSGVKRLRRYRDHGYHPFVLSASPHFYDHTIRTWLKQQGIGDIPIMLKDYRHFISLSRGFLVRKDILTQGFYKLDQLLTLIWLGGVPEDLILLGDVYESDPFTYLTLAKILHEVHSINSARNLWEEIRRFRDFHPTRKQTGLFLNKLYQISQQIKIFKDEGKKIRLRIILRSHAEQTQKHFRENPRYSIYQDYLHLIRFF